MKAAILKDTRTMVCEEVPTPAPGPGEVLVRVAYCGVCGSDVPRYVDGAVHAFPLILGHEFSGTVESTGQGVDAALVGMRVAGIPLVPCMECPDCLAGDFSLCKHYSFIGSRQPGAYAEYVCVPAANVFPISDDVPDLQAAFFEPASVAQHAIDMVFPPEGEGIPGAAPEGPAPAAPEGPAPAAPAPTAVVVGCGTIGIFLAQVLQSMGILVVGLARREARIAAARAAGVERLCDTSEDGWEERLLETLPRGGFDYVFDTSGNNQLMVKSLELAANKATVCFVGTPKRPMQFTVREWENLNRKELVVRATWMSYSAPWPGGEWTRVERAFAAGVLRVADEMIDTIYDLEDIPQGMEKFTIPNSVSGKILVKCG